MRAKRRRDSDIDELRATVGRKLERGQTCQKRILNGQLLVGLWQLPYLHPQAHAPRPAVHDLLRTAPALARARRRRRAACDRGLTLTQGQGCRLAS